MRLYLIPVMGVCFAVDGLLLVAANRLARGPGSPLRLLLAAQLAAVYAAASLQLDLGMTPAAIGRILCLLVVCVVAYGVDLRALSTAAVYLLLTTAALLLAGAMGGGRSDLVVAAVLVVLLQCLLCLQRGGKQERVSVRLQYGGATLQLTALRDTGNTLCDPVTGEKVLVLDAAAANALLGLRPQQLRDPVTTMETAGIAGLRLIPYRTINGQGLLLALRIQDASIDGKRRSIMTAFAPMEFGAESGIRALTGGLV